MAGFTRSSSVKRGCICGRRLGAFVPRGTSLFVATEGHGQSCIKVYSSPRNRWILEKREFFCERAAAAEVVRNTGVSPLDAVKQHPELAGTYLQMRAAELAAMQFRDPQDQRAFVDRVRQALADSVARGEPLQPVRLRERSTKSVPNRTELLERER